MRDPGQQSGPRRAGVDPGRAGIKDIAIPQNLRCNERIRITPIRLIDAEGQQVGVIATRDALAQAREAGLDLVEVAPQAKPPVCRIMDYGKWKYAQKKKERKAKARRHETELKIVRIRTPKIGAHDLEIKVNHAREFFQRGDRVQFVLRFRGREMAHVEVGRKVLDGVKAALADVAKVEQDYHMERRTLTMMLGPISKPASQKPPKPKPAAAPQPEKPQPEAPAPSPPAEPASPPPAAPASPPAEG